MSTMAEKLTITIDTLANEIGVSPKTIRRKLGDMSLLLIKDKRKRWYSQTEAEFIRNIFNPQLRDNKGL